MIKRRPYALGGAAAVAVAALLVVMFDAFGPRTTGSTPHEKDGGQKMATEAGPDAPQDASATLMPFVLAIIDRVTAARFTPLPPDAATGDLGMEDGAYALSALPAIPEAQAIEVDSKKWSGLFFLPAASPWRRFARRDRSYHTASVPDDMPDVLLHEYAVELDLNPDGGDLRTLQLKVYETAKYMVVWIEAGADDVLAHGSRRVQQDRGRHPADAPGARHTYTVGPSPTRGTCNSLSTLHAQGSHFTSDPSVHTFGWM